MTPSLGREKGKVEPDLITVFFLSVLLQVILIEFISSLSYIRTRPLRPSSQLAHFYPGNYQKSSILLLVNRNDLVNKQNRSGLQSKC